MKILRELRRGMLYMRFTHRLLRMYARHCLERHRGHPIGSMEELLDLAGLMVWLQENENRISAIQPTGTQQSFGPCGRSQDPPHSQFAEGSGNSPLPV